VVRLRSSKDAVKNEDSDHADGEQGAEDDALDGVLGFVLHAPIIACPRENARGISIKAQTRSRKRVP